MGGKQKITITNENIAQAESEMNNLFNTNPNSCLIITIPLFGFVARPNSSKDKESGRHCVGTHMEM